MSELMDKVEAMSFMVTPQLKAVDIDEVAPIIQSLQQELKELKAENEWVSVEEFQLEPNEGWCWIIHKGRVTEAYHDHNGRFLYHKFSLNCWMTECISWVQHNNPPTPPVEAD